jgi:hypothetical protein
MVASLCNMVLLEGACLPQEDLSTYSSTWETRQIAPNRGDAAGGTLADGMGASGLDADAGKGGAASAGSVDAPDAAIITDSDASSEPGPADSGAAAELDASRPLADAAP